jgi:hypothetical protein
MFSRAVFYISSRSLVVPKVAATATAAAALWLASRPEACANTASSDELSLNKSLAHDAIEVIGRNMLHATADTTKEDKLNNFMLFGGTSSTVLAEEIANELIFIKDSILMERIPKSLRVTLKWAMPNFRTETHEEG